MKASENDLVSELFLEIQEPGTGKFFREVIIILRVHINFFDFFLKVDG